MNTEKVESIIRELLVEIGENPDREGLVETPRRVAQFWKEFIDYKPGKIETLFVAINADQLVILKDIKVWTLCEHHLLPFWCNISIAYLCDKHIVGISKLARIVHKTAHRLQVQERLVNDIMLQIKTLTQSENVAVIGEGEHLCMTMRGIQTPAKMISSSISGHFKECEALRAEFFNLIK
jgi:GTP cyclohydrolase I